MCLQHIYMGSSTLRDKYHVCMRTIYFLQFADLWIQIFFADWKLPQTNENCEYHNSVPFTHIRGYLPWYPCVGCSWSGGIGAPPQPGGICGWPAPPLGSGSWPPNQTSSSTHQFKSMSYSSLSGDQRHILRDRRPGTTAGPACWAMGINEAVKQCAGEE